MRMTLTEAIEEDKRILKNAHIHALTSRQSAAIELGIEALGRIEHLRIYQPNLSLLALPGETEPIKPFNPCLLKEREPGKDFTTE